MKNSAATASSRSGRSRLATQIKDNPKSRKKRTENISSRAAKRPASTRQVKKADSPGPTHGEGPTSPFMKLVDLSDNIGVEIGTTVQVMLFILGIWFHHLLIRRLFGGEEPTILTTMMPAVEWIMAGVLLQRIFAKTSGPRF